MDGRLIARARRFSSESIYSSLQRQKREIPILLTHRLTLQCGTSVFAETLEREDSLWASTHSFSSAQWPHWLCYWTDHTQECGVSKHLRHLDTPHPPATGYSTESVRANYQSWWKTFYPKYSAIFQMQMFRRCFSLLSWERDTSNLEKVLRKAIITEYKRCSCLFKNVLEKS